jgi:hypothetical protein
VHGKLRELVQHDVPLTKLFQYPTIRTLAGYLTQPVVKPTAAVSARQRAAQQIAIRAAQSTAARAPGAGL